MALELQWLSGGIKTNGFIPIQGLGIKMGVMFPASTSRPTSPRAAASTTKNAWSLDHDAQQHHRRAELDDPARREHALGICAAGRGP